MGFGMRGGGDERNRGAFSLTHEFVILGNLGAPGVSRTPVLGLGPRIMDLQHVAEGKSAR